MALEIIKIIPEYLRAILSWPVAVFGLGLIFILKFSNEICIFLQTNRLSKAGPVEFQQKEEEIEEKIEDSLEQKGITLSEEQIGQLEKEFQELSSKTTEQEEKLKESENFTNFLVQRAELYEFLYLNMFFVPNTKFVLNWSNSSSFTKELFDAQYEIQIPSKLERESIFNALLSNGMLQKLNGNYSITEKGIRFLKFIGFIK